MNSTRKSIDPAATRYAAWIGPIWSDIRLGQRRLLEVNRVPRKARKDR